MIVVSEKNIDVRIEVTLAPGEAQAADSPIRRWGPQRVMLEAGPARTVEVVVHGKERVSGEALVELYGFAPVDDANACLAAYRWLARGDAHYDRGQAVTMARPDAGTTSAQSEYEEAERNYHEAARQLASPESSPVRALAELSRAATFYQVLENYPDTIEPARAAVEAFTLARNDYGRDRARAMAAAANMELALAERRKRNVDQGAESRANDLLASTRDELLALASAFEKRGETYDQALALNNAGLTYNYAREFALAIPYFERAIKLFDALGEQVRKGQATQNLALAQNELGRFADARQQYLRVLGWVDVTENPKLYGDVLNNLALSEYRLGHVDDALRHYAQALEIFTRIQVPREQARSLHGLGVTYYSVGRTAEARARFADALVTRTPDLDRVGRVATLLAIADSERDAGRPAGALVLREEALSLTDNEPLRLRIRIELARDLVESGKPERAETELASVFAANLKEDPVARARALLERARLSFARRDYASARKDSLASFNEFNDLELSAAAFRALILQARVACASKDESSASRLAEDAMARSEELRKSSSNPFFRASSSRGLRPAFDLGIQLAAAPRTCGGAGPPDAIRALSLSEQSRGRALDDFRRIAINAIPGAPTTSELERRKLLERLADKRATLESLADRPGDQKAPMAAVRDEIAALQAQLDVDAERVPEASTTDRRSAENLRQAAERLGPDTAVVEYWLGETRSYAWHISKGRVQMVELGDTAPIEHAAWEFHVSLREFASVSETERVRRARALYTLIIAPLPAGLEGMRRLYFVPDGMLHGIPFSALVGNSSGAANYLVSAHDIAVSGSLQSVPADSQPVQLGKGTHVLIVADPVYASDDSRLPQASKMAMSVPSQYRNLPTLRGAADAKEESRKWARLIASGKEATTIAAAMPEASVETVTGFAANRQALLQRDLSSFRVLHFATHAVADMETPQLSTLVLSLLDDKGMPRVGEVFAGDLLSRPMDADLVVFSGCETAIGQSAGSDGLFSLRYAAHAGGARTVVASLWRVTDVAGAALMSEFYVAMARDRLAPEAALSSAMRKVSITRPDPALWAVFDVSSVAAAHSIH